MLRILLVIWTQAYTYSPDGRIFNGGAWQSDDVFVSGRMLATYSGTNLYCSIADWLGTKRAQITADGSISNLVTIGAFPFGSANQLLSVDR